MKILVVDDHTLFRDALVQYLERAEADIALKVAKDFYEAETLLAKDSYMIWCCWILKCRV